MTCSACVAKIEKVVAKKPGVTSVSVNLIAETCQVSYNPDVTGVRDLIAALKQLGYPARVAGDKDAMENGDADKEREMHKFQRLTLFCVVLSIPALFIMVVPMVSVPLAVHPDLPRRRRRRQPPPPSTLSLRLP